jgi:hypothetical protein
MTIERLEEIFEKIKSKCEGKQNMIVYSVKKVDNPKMGTYLYYVTDALLMHLVMIGLYIHFKCLV